MPPHTPSPPDPSASEAAALARGNPRERARVPALFPAVWRWHFYAGLLTIPVIVLLCLSGIVYLFKPQIDELAWGSMRTVTTQEQRQSFARQEAVVQRAFPDGLIYQVAPGAADDRATEFDVSLTDGTSRRVYVDPYTAQITGSRDPARSLTTIALELHGMLLTNRFLDESGVWGDRIIELTASWAIVLVITGIYLWWPRGTRRARDALVPRMRSTSRRTRWRDLHAVTGVVFAFFTLFLLVSGLAWAGVWGTKVWAPLTQQLGASYPAGLYDGPESRTVDDLIKNGKPAWSAGELPLAPSKLPVTAGSLRGVPELGLAWDPSEGAPLDAIIGRVQRMGFAPGYTVSYPEDEYGSYAIFQFPDADVAPNQSATRTRVAYVDQYTADALREHRFADFGVLAQATDVAIAVHEGRQWGLPNQLLTLTATLALLFSCATAVVMWRRRTPSGLGAPRRQPDRRLGAGVIAITFVLGAVFPLLGASILVLLVVDLVIVRRIGPLARALGAR